MTLQAHRRLLVAAVLATALATPSALAKSYSPGANDKEIRIGNTVPYTGPVSIYGLIGRVEAAYFKKVNDEGGINGRKVVFISYDDAYSPPKALEQARKLVESDEVLAIMGVVGSPTNAATVKYMNQKKVPQLFLSTGATKFGDPKNAPWTMAIIPNYRIEAKVYAANILASNPRAKVAILYQNDDFGKDYLSGLREGLGDKVKTMLVAEAPFETTAPTVDSQVMKLRESGADTLVIAAIGKFASQTIRKAAELGWKPTRYVSNTAIAVDNVLKPAGLENSAGVISAAYRKDPSDPAWANDPQLKEFNAFMEKYLPDGSKNDQAVLGYITAKAMEQVLRQCGADLTRENVMKQAANLKNLELPLLLPGIRMNTTPTDYFPIKQLQTMRFDGDHWVLFGSLYDASPSRK